MIPLTGCWAAAWWRADASFARAKCLAVERVLDGGRAGVRTLDMEAGALVLFRGRYALHRVTPVEGARARLIAVLSYDTKPDVTLTERTRRIFPGRAARLRSFPAKG